MTSFANAVKDNQADEEARTENWMKARKSTASKCCDLFYKIGASRGKDIIPAFVAAYLEDKEIALRIAQWARDVRGGSGERQLYRNILNYLEKNDPEVAKVLAIKTPEIGRWDDLLIFNEVGVRNVAFQAIARAIDEGNGLAAKWMPRKGALAQQLRTFLGMSPKTYRKTLVRLTKVVETQMCAKEWDAINFSHVPSVAASRYKKAFYRHTPKFAEYVAALQKGDPTVKVNASAVYPYDVLKGKISTGYGWNTQSMSATELGHLQAQWDALPNYMGDANVLPLVDVSGSMTSQVGGRGKAKTSLTFLDISVSLGLYCADKNTGKFKDTFLTFSGNPQLLHLEGNIIQKIDQMVRSKWEMNTNLHAALDKILATAKKGKVPQEEMPTMLLILSDMQFDSCVVHDHSAIEMMRDKYANAGYDVPKTVFWNLNAYDNAPVRFDESGTAVVSGFSPAILKSLLKGKIESFTPEQVMLEAVMKEKYNLPIFTQQKEVE